MSTISASRMLRAHILCSLFRRYGATDLFKFSFKLFDGFLLNKGVRKIKIYINVCCFSANFLLLLLLLVDRVNFSFYVEPKCQTFGFHFSYATVLWFPVILFFIKKIQIFLSFFVFQKFKFGQLQSVTYKSYVISTHQILMWFSQVCGSTRTDWTNEFVATSKNDSCWQPFDWVRLDVSTMSMSKILRTRFLFLLLLILLY